MRRLCAFFILFLLSLLLNLTHLASPALAQGGDKAKFEGLLNKLLAPGPLVQGHENLEHKDCLKCHEAGGGVPNNNCLSCHKVIAKDVETKLHFHGQIGPKNCIECHKEHKGRNGNISPIDKKTFNHDMTGFKLDGAHVKAECSECHTEKRGGNLPRKGDPVFKGLKPSCLACHKTDDIHFFESNKFKGKECSSCHITESWKNVEKFDHGKETNYPLAGDHAQLKCVKCHVSEGKNNIKYAWPHFTTQKCLSCHKDQHKDNFNPRFRNGDCLKCHLPSQTDWKIPKFQHDVTGFALGGKHAQIQCVNCHKNNQNRTLPNFNFKGVEKTCGSCHADYHGYGKEIAEKLNAPLQNCASCHTDTSWQANVKFDHAAQTRFPITGKHQKNACFDCHKPLGGARLKSTPNTLRDYFFKTIPEKTCETCHKSTHPASFHKRFKGIPCAQCHSTEGWEIQNMQGQIASNPTFHSKTRFPLDGSHVKLSCKTCHVVKGEEVYKFPSFAKNFCVDCHATPHKNQFEEATLEKSCSTCHTTTKFDPRPTFDHSSTDFKLIGKHQSVQSCWKCHVPSKHNIPGLKVAKPAHVFKFDESKDARLCANCHTTVHKKQLKEEFLKKSCAVCHTAHGFEKFTDFDHNVTDFKLTGSHEKLANKCVECHKPNKDIILPTKPPKVGKQFIFPGQQKGYCENCHVNEHKGMFDPKFANKACVSCHSTQAFSPRKAFDHDSTEFELKGKHKQVKCAECHTPTKERFDQGKKEFKGKYDFPEMGAKNCATCHKDPHNGGNGNQCTKCHTEAGWKTAGDFHKDMELVGVHLLTDCKSCHSKGRTLKGSSQECSTCHIKDDNHNGQLPVCSDCHLQNFWNQTKFDHNMTRFPLQGAHRVTECRACHNQGVYQGLPTDCRSCHFKDAQTVTTPDHNSPRFFLCETCHSSFSFPGAVPN